MIYNNVMLTVKKPDDIEAVKALLKKQALLSSDEPGCHRFEVYHSKVDKRQFLLIEQWETEEHLALHKEAKAFTELYLPQVIPLVERTPHLCDLVWP